MFTRTYMRALVAAFTLVAMLCQGTLVLAGTTGQLTGTATDASTNAPIAGAKITAASPSQSATAITDAGGHFSFLSRADIRSGRHRRRRQRPYAKCFGRKTFADDRNRSFACRRQSRSAGYDRGRVLRRSGAASEGQRSRGRRDAEQRVLRTFDGAGRFRRAGSVGLHRRFGHAQYSRSTAYRLIARSITIPPGRPRLLGSKNCKFIRAAPRRTRKRRGYRGSSIRSSKRARIRGSWMRISA